MPSLPNPKSSPKVVGPESLSSSQAPTDEVARRALIESLEHDLTRGPVGLAAKKPQLQLCFLIRTHLLLNVVEQNPRVASLDQLAEILNFPSGKIGLFRLTTPQGGFQYSASTQLARRLAATPLACHEMIPFIVATTAAAAAVTSLNREAAETGGRQISFVEIAEFVSRVARTRGAELFEKTDLPTLVRDLLIGPRDVEPDLAPEQAQKVILKDLGDPRAIERVSEFDKLQFNLRLRVIKRLIGEFSPLKGTADFARKIGASEDELLTMLKIYRATGAVVGGLRPQVAFEMVRSGKITAVEGFWLTIPARRRAYANILGTASDAVELSEEIALQELFVGAKHADDYRSKIAARLHECWFAWSGETSADRTAKRYGFFETVMLRGRQETLGRMQQRADVDSLSELGQKLEAEKITSEKRLRSIVQLNPNGTFCASFSVTECLSWVMAERISPAEAFFFLSPSQGLARQLLERLELFDPALDIRLEVEKRISKLIRDISKPKDFNLTALVDRITQTPLVIVDDPTSAIPHQLPAWLRKINHILAEQPNPLRIPCENVLEVVTDLGFPKNTPIQIDGQKNSKRASIAVDVALGLLVSGDRRGAALMAHFVNEGDFNKFLLTLDRDREMRLTSDELLLADLAIRLAAARISVKSEGLFPAPTSGKVLFSFDDYRESHERWSKNEDLAAGDETKEPKDKAGISEDDQITSFCQLRCLDSKANSWENKVNLYGVTNAVADAYSVDPSNLANSTVLKDWDILASLELYLEHDFGLAPQALRLVEGITIGEIKALIPELLRKRWSESGYRVEFVKKDQQQGDLPPGSAVA